jgi:membrane protein DedA with SNARE-associated domain
MKTAFIVSGVLGFLIWPIVMAAGVMLMDAPNVPLRTEILRQLAAYSAILVPPFWVAALLLAIIESRRRKRPRFLRAYAIAPYAAAGTHAIALIALFILKN